MTLKTAGLDLEQIELSTEGRWFRAVVCSMIPTPWFGVNDFIADVETVATNHERNTYERREA